MRKFPQDITLNLEDFVSSRWKTAIDSAKRGNYSEIWQALSQAANSAMDEEATKEAKVLWLLADSCSMILNPKSINEPFRPYSVFDGKRSALPEDFDMQDIDFLAQIADKIDNQLVQARISDIVWLCKKPRDVSFALLAIDAYCSIPVELDIGWRHSHDCWKRAIVLTRQLKKGAGNRLQKIEELLLEKFNTEPQEINDSRLSVSQLIFDNNLGQSHTRSIADKLKEHGDTLFRNSDYYHARSYLEAAARGYACLGEREALADITCLIAETWVGEAIARIETEQPSHIVATGFYENAIQTFRKVPRELRASRKVDERISELHRCLDKSGKASLDEMGVISSGDIDVTELVQSIKASVEGKPFLEALSALSLVHNGARKRRISDSAEKSLQENPIQAMVSATHVSSDGRVIAKRPGVGFGNQDTDEYRTTHWAEMVKNYSMELSLVTQAQILPALDSFLVEHRVREVDIFDFVSQSPVVPIGRVKLISKAIFSGFERDFVSALYLLVPQVEHLVRAHLKSHNVKTTTLDTDGVENEIGLSSLVDLPEMQKVFGENLTFEFKAVFCDPWGPNLRNEVAHGLLDDDGSHSIYAVYAWWLLFHLIFNAFWVETRKASGNLTDNGEVSEFK